VDPESDIETIETELIYADLEQAERRLERVVKQARSGDKAAVAEEAWLRQVIDALQEGRWARTVPPPADAPDALRNLWPLTGKPVLYVVNVAEGDEESIPESVADHAAKTGAGVVAISARIEAELAELDDEEAAAMREDLGAGESGLGRVIRAAFELLELISFFTAGEGKEAKAYAIHRGTTAQGAAGDIHTDIQKGFVRAEILPWSTLVEQNGYAGARDKGLLRIEGRDYVMQDGDVMTVRFTP
jgi:GTP-binding protein YchF